MSATMENNQSRNLPLGYKFSPSPSELIVHYLCNKLLGRSLPADIIPTFDCFSVSPSHIPLDMFECGAENEWYFFATSREGKVVTTDDGYYEVFEEKEKYYGEKIIGFVRKFKFHHGEPGNGTLSTEWTIKEYQVHPQLLDQMKPILVTDSKLVACKVIRHGEELPTSATNTTTMDFDKFEVKTDTV